MARRSEDAVQTDGTQEEAGRQLPTKALLEYMTHGWEPSPSEATSPMPIASWCASRRARLAGRFAGDWLVLPTGLPKVRANDTDFPFRPGSDFAWLTGIHEPYVVLVLAPGTGRDGATLYMPTRAGRGSPAFFTDSRDGELWVGRRPRPDEVETAFGLATAPLDDLLTALKAAPPERLRALRGFDAEVDSLVVGLRGDGDDSSCDQELARVLSELRLVKDDYEVRSLQDAVDATVRGFEEVVRELPEAVATSERWIEGTFRRRARVEGNDIAYGVIAAAGPHACTLHWVANDGPVVPGELVLVDAGVESTDLYAADVTRTLPVSGRFSETQREVYEVVWEAQQAALAQCRPGNSFDAPHRAAMAVITRWLVDKGFLPPSEDDPMHERSMLYRRFTLHGTSHMLGLDVHDCAQARNEYIAMDLQPGMVLTVEPGCYFQPDDATVPASYRGIGVRIEDDVLITAEGCRVLSAALPTKADDVERWMASLSSEHTRLTD